MKTKKLYIFSLLIMQLLCAMENPGSTRLSPVAPVHFANAEFSGTKFDAHYSATYNMGESTNPIQSMQNGFNNGIKHSIQETTQVMLTNMIMAALKLDDGKHAINSSTERFQAIIMLQQELQKLLYNNKELFGKEEFWKLRQGILISSFYEKLTLSQAAYMLLQIKKIESDARLVGQLLPKTISKSSDNGHISENNTLLNLIHNSNSQETYEDYQAEDDKKLAAYEHEKIKQNIKEIILNPDIFKSRWPDVKIAGGFIGGSITTAIVIYKLIPFIQSFIPVKPA